VVVPVRWPWSWRSGARSGRPRARRWCGAGGRPGRRDARTGRRRL